MIQKASCIAFTFSYGILQDRKGTLLFFFHILLCYMELCYCTVYKDHDSVLLDDVRYVYHFQPAVTGVYAAMH